MDEEDCAQIELLNDVFTAPTQNGTKKQALDISRRMSSVVNDVARRIEEECLVQNVSSLRRSNGVETIEQYLVLLL